MSYIPQSAQIGGRTFRGAWKPYGYDKAPPTGQYSQVNPMYQWGGAALGFGATIARNWQTVQPALAAWWAQGLPQWEWEAQQEVP